eukprot:TRINITY_DN14762_c0_g2_i1.p1 TRINITY_DN14762_c0_g2~~TRINITY_DN14762_c0_g2_i1.p1  ORF type:complete len:1425 (+),score=374.93 TRINITY_DN14762_c0_g2_i1:77-4351(+)
MNTRLPMHAFWQGGATSQRRERRGQTISDGDPRIALLKDVSGGELTDNAVKKLLSRNDGDVEAAANTFFQMSAQDGMIQSMNDDAEDGDAYTVALTLPRECLAFPETFSWIGVHCESIGYGVELRAQPPATPAPVVSHSIDFKSTNCLSTSPSKLASAPSQPVSVKLHTELVKNIMKRDRDAMITQSGGGSEARLTAHTADILSICSADEACSLPPKFPQTPTTTSSSLEKQLQSAAKHIYKLSFTNGDVWQAPPAVLALIASESTDTPHLTTVIQSETNISSSDPALLMAIKNTAAKVKGFVRYGDIDNVQSFIQCFEALYQDTRIFHKADGGRHVFIACGVASVLASGWFSGRMVHNVTCDQHVFKQAEGLAALKDRVFNETQCSFFFRSQLDDGTIDVGMVGPQEKRAAAVALINKHKHVKECIMRIPPTYGKLFDDNSPKLQEKLGCSKFIVEGGGKIRVVGSPEAIYAAKETISSLCKHIAKMVQHNRLKEITGSVMANIMRIEVKVQLPPKVQELLRQPVFNSGNKKYDEKAGGIYKRSIDEIQRRATVLWAALDGLIDEITKVLQQENVLQKDENLNVGVAATGVRVGDYIKKGNGWQGVVKERETRNGGRLLQEFVAGKPLQMIQFKKARVQKIEPGVQIGGASLVSVVTDWVKCTLDPSKPDPGRPVCDVLTITWENEGKALKQDVTCPGTRMIVKDTSEPEAQPDSHPLITLSREVLRLSYLSTVDETLLTELNRVVNGLEGNGRTQNTILERCRQRCREMGVEATEECYNLMEKIRKRPKNKVTELLLQHMEVIENEWTQACKVAEWENDMLLSKTRMAVDEEERAERWTRTARDAFHKISLSTGAFFDYVPPNDYVLVTGDEVNVRTAVKCIKDLKHEGVQGLEEEKSYTLTAEEVAQLTENNNLLLQLIQHETGLKAAVLKGNKLTLTGTMVLIKQAVGYLGRGEGGEEEQQLECNACLMDYFGEGKEDKVLVDLLCGHSVHPGCVARFLKSRHAMDAEEGCTTKSPCRCPVTSCGYTITPNEYCSILQHTETPLPSTLDNINTMIAAYIHTQDRVRNCPSCNKWVIGSGITEPVCCTHCGEMFCGQRNPQCNGVPHYFSTCDQYVKARRKMEKQPDDAPAPALPSNVVMCAKCPAWILREDDAGDDRCRYMKCRQCSYEFCWLCLIPSIDHRHVNPQNIAQSVECDPENRDDRRERLMRSHEVALWKGYAWCDRCGKVAGKDEELYGCEVCLNHYYCSSCVGKGCLTSTKHVVRQVALEDPPAKTNDALMCPGGHVLQQQRALQPSFSCDNCKKSGEPTLFMGCRVCDYDLCKYCAHQSKKSGGDLLAEAHLPEMEVPQEFWRALVAHHPEIKLCSEANDDRAEPMDVDVDDEPKKLLIEFISGSIMLQLRSFRANGAGGLIAAMLGIQQ